jgi:hypothetical protein
MICGLPSGRHGMTMDDESDHDEALAILELLEMIKSRDAEIEHLMAALKPFAQARVQYRSAKHLATLRVKTCYVQQKPLHL